MNRTILVIEKDESILELVTFILKGQGFTVISLESEQDAIQTIREVNPCAVILDIIRVTEEGTELCRQIRNAKDIQDIPIIVLSTHPKADIVKDICADEVVLKPFDIDEVVAAVEKHVVS
jgi:DNA-binding response OmpR family regulator